MTIYTGAMTSALLDKLDTPMAMAVKEVKEEFGDDVLIRPKTLEKFGANFDVDSTALGTLEDVTQARAAASANENRLSDNLITHLITSDAGNTHQVFSEGMTISGGNLTFVRQPIVSNGQTAVALSTPICRSTRLENLSGDATAGNMYLYTGGSTTGGIPDDLDTVYNMLSAPYETSLKAGTSIASNNYFFLTSLYASVSRGSSGATADIYLMAGAIDAVLRSRHAAGIAEGTPYNPPFENVLTIPPNSDMIMQATVSAANTRVFGGFNGVFADIIDPQTLGNLNIGTDWVDVNTALGVDVGIPMIVQNLGQNKVYAALKDTSAPGQSTGFNELKPLDQGGGVAYISQGSPRLWLRASAVSETVSIQLAV